MKNSLRFTIVAAVILIFATSPAAQQRTPGDTIDALANKLLQEVPYFDTCTIMWYNAQCILPDYYDRGHIDSVERIMAIIDSVCDKPLFDTLNLLRQIESDDFPEDWYNFELEAALLDAPECYMWGSCIDWSGPPCMDKYKAFLDTLATIQARRVDSTSMAHVFCSYYLGKDWYIRNRLHEGGYPGLRIQREYDRRLTAVKRDLRSWKHMSMGLGLWTPTGNADVLGHMAELGMEFGLRKDWYGIDGTILTRLLGSSEFHEEYYNEQLVPTDRITAIGFGINLVTELVRSKRYRLELFAGGGHDSFTIYSDENQTSVGSNNLNSGLTIFRFLGDTYNDYFALRFRYNIVDYGNVDGLDLSGNTISISVLWGFIWSRSSVGQARHLGYFD
jgi:hypothetical protein